MSLHDEYARLTPYELTFPDPETAASLSAAIGQESDGRGADASDPHAFVTMGAVTAFVNEMREADAPAGVIHEYGALTYHGIHFTRAGCPLFMMSTHVARYLVDGSPGGDTTPPATAGYLQLPQHLFWTDPGNGVPESVDGAFWTVSDRGVMRSLMVTGMRPGRPGFGILPLPDAPMEDAPTWLDVDARGTASDFSSTLPGSDMDRLYSFETSGEVLKLLARFFAYAAGVSGGLVVGERDPHATDAVPQPSALPFTRVVLSGAA